MPKDINDELIPLDKLISRLRTDLKLAQYYKDKYNTDVVATTAKKNKQKASLLYYLERLKELIPQVNKRT